ncbi:MAG: hypothetical protein PHH26_00365 [Candidatus Thermoplasmatota archaeon]|nr:hypothetical protein [Candidatus Thermoplasmatota archaeon]
MSEKAPPACVSCIQTGENAKFNPECPYIAAIGVADKMKPFLNPASGQCIFSQGEDECSQCFRFGLAKEAGCAFTTMMKVDELISDPAVVSISAQLKDFGQHLVSGKSVLDMTRRQCAKARLEEIAKEQTNIVRDKVPACAAEREKFMRWRELMPAVANSHQAAAEKPSKQAEKAAVDEQKLVFGDKLPDPPGRKRYFMRIPRTKRENMMGKIRDSMQELGLPESAFIAIEASPGNSEAVSILYDKVLYEEEQKKKADAAPAEQQSIPAMNGAPAPMV